VGIDFLSGLQLQIKEKTNFALFLILASLAESSNTKQNKTSSGTIFLIAVQNMLAMLSIISVLYSTWDLSELN
jgi:hypothetical protein